MTPSSRSTGAHPAAYRFAGFELRLRTRQLLGGEGEIALQAKVFDLIAYLLQHADRAVDKNELLDAVWPRQVVTEAALARCVMKARRALDDDAQEPRILHTVHGRGYRILAPVEQLDQCVDPEVRAAEPTGVQSDVPQETGAVRPETRNAPLPSREPPARIAPAPASAPGGSSAATPQPAARPLRLIVVGSLGLLALVLALGALWRQFGPLDTPASVPLRLAILPVHNDTGDSGLDWASLALMAAIGDLLEASDGVPVVAAAEILPLYARVEGLPPAEQWQRLHEDLGSSHLVRARLLTQPGQLRLSYELLGPGGAQRRRSVVAADVAGLAHAAGHDLLAALGMARAEGALVDDAFANEAFLRGHALRLQGDLPAAADMFRLAIEQVPEAFWPRYELALCQRDLGQGEVALASLQGLQAEADRGDSLEARLSVRNAQAILQWRAGNYPAAEGLLQEALQLAEQQGEPGRISSVFTNLGILADFRDQPELARGYLQRATETALASGQPRVPANIRHTLAQIELRADNLEAGEEHLRAALDGFRRIGNRRFEAVVLNSLTRLRRRQGQLDEARELAEQAIAAHRALGTKGAETSALQALAAIERDQGRITRALEVNAEALAIAEAIGESPQAGLAERQRAQLEAARGDWAAAHHWLQRALQRFEHDQDHPAARRTRLQRIDLWRREGKAAAAQQAWDTHAAESDAADSSSLRRDACLLQVRLWRDAGRSGEAREQLRACPSAPASATDARIDAALLAAELELDSAQADAAEAILTSLPALAERDPDSWKLRARLSALRGDLASALEHERQAQRLAGERWLAVDQARLADRERAAASGKPPG